LLVHSALMTQTVHGIIGIEPNDVSAVPTSRFRAWREREHRCWA
jgi:hypothetical protein